MAATKGVSHWNRLYRANGRKLDHTIKNLRTITYVVAGVHKLAAALSTREIFTTVA